MKEFVFCEHCADEANETLFTCSADFDAYCANGHFFQPKRSEFDGRTEMVLREIAVERDESQDVIAVDRTQINNGGDYDYIAYRRTE